MSNDIPKIIYKHLGLVPYSVGHELQREIHGRVASGLMKGAVISLEHSNVLTLGKHSSRDNILLDSEDLARKNIELVEIDRGGQVTAHNPGQLVVYPILHQKLFSFSPRKFVAAIEDAVIGLLKDFNIDGRKDEEHPGVWVGESKICSIGVRISKRTSLHGLALNVGNCLDIFDTIVPCGIQGRGVTSMSHVLGKCLTIEDVSSALVGHLMGRFETEIDPEMSQLEACIESLKLV